MEETEEKLEEKLEGGQDDGAISASEHNKSSPHTSVNTVSLAAPFVHKGGSGVRRVCGVMLTSATVRNPVDVLVLAAAAAAAAATAGAAAAAAAAAACCEYEINVREQNKSAPHTYVNKGSPRPSLARLLRNSLPPPLPSSTSTGKKWG